MRDFLQGDKFISGMKLSAVCLLLLIPNLAWKYFIGYSEYVERLLGPDEMFPTFLRDVFLIWVALQISATAGFAWSKRPALAGAENWGAFRNNMKMILLFALGILVIEAGIFDLWILRPALDMYPRNPLTSTAYAAEEVIYRFGIMAITFRLTRSVTAAVITAALFNVASTIPGVFLEGPKVPMVVMYASAAKALAFATFYGFFCARKGLYSTMALRMLVGLKFVVYAFLRL